MCHGEGVSVINHLHIVFMTFDAEGPLLGFNLCGSQETVENSEIDGETVETGAHFIFGAPESLQMVTATMKLKDAYSLEEKL